MVDSRSYRNGLYVYSVTIRHPSSGKPWELSNVLEQTPRFYRAGAGLYDLGDRVIVARANSRQPYEIIGAIPEGHENDPATIAVGDAAVSLLPARDGEDAAISHRVDRATVALGPESYDATVEGAGTIAIGSGGPSLASSEWNLADHSGRLEVHSGAEQTSDEQKLYFVLMDLSSSLIPVAGEGLELALSGDTDTAADHAHGLSGAGKVVLPVYLSSTLAAGSDAALSKGEYAYSAPTIYQWAAPTIANAAVRSGAGGLYLSAQATVSVPPQLSFADIHLIVRTGADSLAALPVTGSPFDWASTTLRMPPLEPLLDGNAADVKVEDGVTKWRIPRPLRSDLHYAAIATHVTTAGDHSINEVAYDSSGQTGAERRHAYQTQLLNLLEGAGLVERETFFSEAGVQSAGLSLVDVTNRYPRSPTSAYLLAWSRIYP